jgi:hypothetical protein
VTRVIEEFLSLDPRSPVRHEADARTRFRVENTLEGETAEIVFGPDIFPGTNIVDPNSSLGMRAACAHELVHYYRWRDATELPQDELVEIDEALTSLGAILHFQNHFSETEIRQLVSDAAQRLARFVQSWIDLQQVAPAQRGLSVSPDCQRCKTWMAGTYT